MTNPHDQPNDLFRSLSEPEITKELPKETTTDALSIVLDAINSSVGGMIITDKKGIIRFANPSFCRMFNYGSSGIIGKNASELFSTEEIGSLQDVIAIIDISRNNTEEFVVKGSEGTTFIVEVSASDVTAASGEVVGRMASFVDISRRKKVEADRETLIKKLQDALERIKTLRGIIPICASCKSIRDDKGYWNRIETYIKEHSEADFTHGICPDCAKKLYPDFYK